MERALRRLPRELIAFGIRHCCRAMLKDGILPYKIISDHFQLLRRNDQWKLTWEIKIPGRVILYGMRRWVVTIKSGVICEVLQNESKTREIVNG